MPTVYSLKGHMGGNQAPGGGLSHMSDKRFPNLDRSPKTPPIVRIDFEGETPHSNIDQ